MIEIIKLKKDELPVYSFNPPINIIGQNNLKTVNIDKSNKVLLPMNDFIPVEMLYDVFSKYDLIKIFTKENKVGIVFC